MPVELDDASAARHYGDWNSAGGVEAISHVLEKLPRDLSGM